MPGALTPTEVIAAWEAGADVVKIFPSDLGGALPTSRPSGGPLPQIRMMPTGGVDLGDRRRLPQGRGACCLGGRQASLVEPKAVASGDLDRLRDLAGQFSALVRDFRGPDMPTGANFPRHGAWGWAEPSSDFDRRDRPFSAPRLPGPGGREASLPRPAGPGLPHHRPRADPRRRGHPRQPGRRPVRLPRRRPGDRLLVLALSEGPAGGSAHRPRPFGLPPGRRRRGPERRPPPGRAGRLGRRPVPLGRRRPPARRDARPPGRQLRRARPGPRASSASSPPSGRSSGSGRSLAILGGGDDRPVPDPDPGGPGPLRPARRDRPDGDRRRLAPGRPRGGGAGGGGRRRPGPLLGAASPSGSPWSPRRSPGRKLVRGDGGPGRPRRKLGAGFCDGVDIRARTRRHGAVEVAEPRAFLHDGDGAWSASPEAPPGRGRHEFGTQSVQSSRPVDSVQAGHVRGR